MGKYLKLARNAANSAELPEPSIEPQAQRAAPEDTQRTRNGRPDHTTKATKATKGGSQGTDATLGELRSRRENLSTEEHRRVCNLVRQGMSETWARRTVLASDHPLDCDCEVCL